MKYKLHTLKNGLRVVLVPQSEALSATVMVMTGTGSRHETPKINGISHFLEHMMFKGTKRRATPKIIADELDGLGAESNAFTSKDHTAYFAKVSGEHTGKALDIISDIFLNSKIDSRELNKERGAVIEEISMYEDMPMRSIFEEFEALLFGVNTPLGRTIAGPKKNIRKLTRKDMLEYRRKRYVAENSVICVAGKFVQSKILANIRKSFDKMSSSSTNSHHNLSVEFADIVTQVPRVHIKYKDTDQTHFMLGVPAYEYNHKDEIPLMLLSTILGSGMSSRLFTEVREKRGLAYHVSTTVEQYVDTGYLSSRAGVTHKNLKKAVKIILQEFEKIKNNLSAGGVSARELKKAKSQLKGTLALSLDTSDAVANYFSTGMILRGKITTPENMAKEIDSVTVKNIQRVAKDIFQTPRLNLSVIGPHKNEKELFELLEV